MKHSALFSGFMLLFAPTFAFGACSIANLTRCLDSACAINIGANPAARCQYCGTSAAGTPSKSTAMKSISAGSSARYNIPDKDLKKAPSDPGERYIWATQICLNKVMGCTVDDVTDNYDSLIEQSCTAAGISAEMSNLAQKANKGKTQSDCSTEIETCVMNEKHCNADYSNCKSDTDFDKHFSDCVVSALGCDSFSKTIRSTLIATRDDILKQADIILDTIVAAYQSARDSNTELIKAENNCKNSYGKAQCVKYVCGGDKSGLYTGPVMPHGCPDTVEYEYERALAEQLCEYYDTACERMK